MHAKSASITDLPPSPDAERHLRMIKYAVAMGLRVLCIIACLVVPGWWRLIPAAGAVFLPYFAVVVANTVRSTAGEVERPGSNLPVPVAPAPGDGKP